MRWCAFQIPAACSIFLALSKKYTSQLVINFEEWEWDGKHTWELAAGPYSAAQLDGGGHSWMRQAQLGGGRA